MCESFIDQKLASNMAKTLVTFLTVPINIYIKAVKKEREQETIIQSMASLKFYYIYK